MIRISLITFDFVDTHYSTVTVYTPLMGKYALVKNVSRPGEISNSMLPKKVIVQIDD